VFEGLLDVIVRDESEHYSQGNLIMTSSAGLKIASFWTQLEPSVQPLVKWRAENQFTASLNARRAIISSKLVLEDQEATCCIAVM
jgi:hypothetical protein